MVEAISHLIHRDYEAIVQDFVTLQFIPPKTNLDPILPVLAKVFDQALEGGGAKNINFQDLAADLAQITFDYPFRIPPYFALIIRAIGVLEGIALVGDPDFALVDEAYPYLSKMLLTDESPRLREALRYTLYGNGDVLDVERMAEVLAAFETFQGNSTEAGGTALQPQACGFGGGGGAGRGTSDLLVSPSGKYLRDILIDELAKAIDALTRSQLWGLAQAMGLGRAFVPVLIPGAVRPLVPLAPRMSAEDEMVVANFQKLAAFASTVGPPTGSGGALSPQALAVAGEVAPAVAAKLVNRLSARAIRELYTL